MRRVAPGLLVVAAACSDPDGRCPAEGLRLPGAGCTLLLREIVADGLEDDWGAGTSHAGSVEGGVTQLRAGQTFEGELALLVAVRGEALRDGHSYELVLEPLLPPSYALAIRFGATAEPEVQLNGAALAGFPLEHALGPAAIEVLVPLRALPFNGGLRATAELDVTGDLGEWLDVPGGARASALCWDPSSPVCQAIER